MHAVQQTIALDSQIPAQPALRRSTLAACLVPAIPEDLVIEEVVRELCAIHRARSLSLLLDVGAVVVERLYGGDLAQVRSRGRKDKSLRKLCRHPRLPFSAATLWRAISIYEIVRRFPGLINARSLGVSHLRAVIGLPPGVQENLLRAAQLEKWDTARIAKAAAVYRAAHPKSGGGRPASPAMVKIAASVHRIMEAAPAPDACAIASLDSRRRLGLRTALASLRAWCDGLQRELDRTDGVAELNA
jgi:hypothetical protein